MMKISKNLISSILVLFYTGIQTSNAQKTYEPNWESIYTRPVATWFEDAKFGIFIHRSPYSVPAWSPKATNSEWNQYWVQIKTIGGNGQFSGTEVCHNHVATYGEWLV